MLDLYYDKPVGKFQSFIEMLSLVESGWILRRIENCLKSIQLKQNSLKHFVHTILQQNCIGKC